MLLFAIAAVIVGGSYAGVKSFAASNFVVDAAGFTCSGGNVNGCSFVKETSRSKSQTTVLQLQKILADPWPQGYVYGPRLTTLATKKVCVIAKAQSGSPTLRLTITNGALNPSPTLADVTLPVPGGGNYNNIGCATFGLNNSNILPFIIILNPVDGTTARVSSVTVYE